MSSSPATGPTANPVPFPPVWSRARPSVSWGLVAFSAALAVVLAFATLGGLSVGNPWVAVGCALGTAFFVATSWAGLRSRRWPGRRRPVVERVDGGLRFPYSAFAWRTMVALVVGVVPFALAVLVAAWTDPDPSRRTQLMKFAGPVLVAYALVFAWSLARRRIRRGAVLLTPQGVTHEAWAETFSVRWADVEEVSAVVLTGGNLGPAIRVSVRPGHAATHEVRSRTIGSPSRQDLPHLTVRADQVQGDAALLAHALAFYATGPEHRAELGDGRALERVLEGRVVTQGLTQGENDEPA